VTSVNDEPAGRRQALLLSGSLGLGHEMLVRVCGQAFEQSGWEVRSLDSIELLGKRCGRAGQRFFTWMVGSVPGFYDGLHFAHLRTGSPLAGLMDRSSRTRLLPALREHLSAHPAEVILSVFSTGASAAAALKAETPSRRAVTLCTDVTLHRLWVAKGTDLFLVTSPAAAASVLRYLPSAEVAVIPPPVRPSFYAAPSKSMARAELGLGDDACVLLIDSGWGFGSRVAGAQALARAGIDVLAVAGRRRDVETRLRDLATQETRVQPFGFVEDVALLMAAADVVIALPGATTCSEARAVGRPLLLLDVMPGHGRENLLHELEQGDARMSGPAPHDMVAGVRSLLDSAPTAARRTERFETAFVAALRTIGVELVAPTVSHSNRSRARTEPGAISLGAGRRP
jgi:processive 1,2-diacylglycerol beta-glucosyltransferase